jgi:hypothetical protein
MRKRGEDHDHGQRRPSDARRRFPKLCVAWLNLKEAVDWAHEQDILRQAERRRFAQERARLSLEALWDLPAFSRERPATSPGA